jgi:hypothetical protein
VAESDAATAVASDDIGWEDVVFEDEHTAALRRQQNQRDRSSQRRRSLTSQPADENSEGSEWLPVNGHHTHSDGVDSEEGDDSDADDSGSDTSTPVTIDRADERSHPSLPFSSSSAIMTILLPPPAAAVVEGKEAHDVDAHVASEARSGATGLLVPLHTEVELAYANLPPRDMVLGDGSLSAPARAACNQLRKQHLQQIKARAQQAATGEY